MHDFFNKPLTFLLFYDIIVVLYQDKVVKRCGFAKKYATTGGTEVLLL